MRTILAAATAALALAATPAAAVTILNASFEDPALDPGEIATRPDVFVPGTDGWTTGFTSRVGIASNGSVIGLPDAPDGTQAAFVQNTTESLMGLSQVGIALTEGGWYQLSFYIASIPDLARGGVKILVNSSPIGEFWAPEDGGWGYVTTGPFQALSLNSILFLTAYGSSNPTPFEPNGFGLDMVTITETSAPVAGIPEPATWAMMLAGFGLAGSALRSRRRAAHGAANAASPAKNGVA